MNPDKTTLILGPPGTGKTTRLMSQLDKVFRSYSPRSVCFISFTKKAANEALERACHRFDLFEDDLPLFRTLHSLAFEFLHLRRNNIMNPSDYYALAKETGTSISFDSFDAYGMPEGRHMGNLLLSVISQGKIRQLTLHEAWSKYGDQIDYDELVSFDDKLSNYKLMNNKMDFDDIIQEYTNSGTVPPLHVLFIDEAQDLSSIQWKMAEKLSIKANEVFLAGDDDQSIYEWAGADVQHFINLQGRVETLGQSWRVPPRIKEVSNRIIDRISERREKSWKSVGEEQGQVEYIRSPLELIDEISKGQWLLLARTNGLLRDYEEMCIEAGVFYRYAHKAKDFKDLVLAVRTWEALKAGGLAVGRRVKLLYGLMSSVERVKHGIKSKVNALEDNAVFTIKQLKEDYGLLCSALDWSEALDRITDTDRDYMERALELDDIDEPRITISTIHGAKGGEADNVVLLSDMGLNAYNAMIDNGDSEHRVWYVGVTRAKKKLYICEPSTQYIYDL